MKVLHNSAHFIQKCKLIKLLQQHYISIALFVLEGAYINQSSFTIYDGLTTVNHISNLYQSAMASMNLADYLSSFALIQADGEGVLISFPLGSDGIAVVTIIRLGLRFQLNIDSLHIDKEVFDLVTGDLYHTICQLFVCNGDGKHWLLGPRKFRLYGLSKSIMAATTGLATPLSSPLTSRMKVEPGLQSVTILSDDSDMSSPL
jgi:hypothetical protein